MILATSLVLLWAGLAAWQWRVMEEPAHVPLTNITGPAFSGQRAEAMGAGWRVNLELLASAGVQREASFTAPRNIFAVPRPDGSLSLSQAPAVEQQEGSPSDETVAEQTEAVESAPYQYLGFLRMGEGRQKNNDMAVLRKDDEVMVLKVGDHVADRLILRAITAESVTIRDIDTRMDKTLVLSEETQNTVEQE